MEENKEVVIDARDAQAKSLGAIKVVEVGDKRLYLKMPNRHAIGVAFAQIEGNAVKAYETIARAAAIRECSDMDIIEVDELFLSAMSGIGEFLGEIQLKKSTLRAL